MRTRQRQHYLSDSDYFKDANSDEYRYRYAKNV